jgi:hypothetical protein
VFTSLPLLATSIHSSKYTPLLWKRRENDNALSIDDVWERFQGQGGFHQIEGLCTALLKEGCDGGVVDEAKDETSQRW